MKRTLLYIIFGLTQFSYSQVDSNLFLGVPQFTNAEMLATTVGVDAGNVIFNTDENSLYQFNGSVWVKLAEELKKTLVLNRAAGGGNGLLPTQTNTFFDFPINNTHLQVNTSPSTYTVIGNGTVRVLEDGVYLMSGELSTRNMPAGSTKYILGIFINGARRGYLTRGFVTVPGGGTDFWGATGVLMYLLNANDEVAFRYVLNAAGNVTLDLDFANIGITKI